MKNLSWLVILFSIVVPMRAISATAPLLDISGAELKSVCASTDQMHIAECRFYIFGVSEGIALGRQTASTPNLFCMPDGLDAKQMAAKVQLIMNLMDKKLLGLPAVAMVGAALNNAYPCPKAP